MSDARLFSDYKDEVAAKVTGDLVIELLQTKISDPDKRKAFRRKQLDKLRKTEKGVSAIYEAHQLLSDTIISAKRLLQGIEKHTAVAAGNKERCDAASEIVEDLNHAMLIHEITKGTGVNLLYYRSSPGELVIQLLKGSHPDVEKREEYRKRNLDRLCETDKGVEAIYQAREQLINSLHAGNHILGQLKGQDTFVEQSREKCNEAGKIIEELVETIRRYEITKRTDADMSFYSPHMGRGSE